MNDNRNVMYYYEDGKSFEAYFVGGNFPSNFVGIAF